MIRAHARSQAVRARLSKRASRPDGPQRTEASAEASSSPNSTTAANGASTALIRIVVQTGGRMFSSTAESLATVSRSPHSWHHQECGRPIAVAARWTAVENIRPPSRVATCQLFILPPVPWRLGQDEWPRWLVVQGGVSSVSVRSERLEQRAGSVPEPQ